MSTRDQRQTAFRNAGAILVLERMVEPEGYAQLRQEVIDGRLSFDEAVAKVEDYIPTSARNSSLRTSLAISSCTAGKNASAVRLQAELPSKPLSNL